MARKSEQIRAHLTNVKQSVRDLEGRIATTAGVIDALRPRLLASAVAGLNLSAEQIDAAAVDAAGPFWTGWTHPLWTEFHGVPPGTILHDVRIGRMLEPSALPGETARPDIARLVPLLELNAPLILLCDAGTQPVARQMMQSIILRLALAMPTESRFTLIDPVGLGAAFPFRGQLPASVRNTGRTPADELAEVLEDVRRINERVIGHAPRFLNLSADQRAGESFEFVAAVDFPKAFQKEPRAVENLVKLGNSGPRAGRHLILEWNADLPLPHDFSADQFEKAHIIDLRKGGFKADGLPTGESLQRLFDIAKSTTTQRKSGDWGSVVRPAALFSESAAAFVETPIGERLRVWFGEKDADGKQSAHGMVAGQTGSGKSFLLHVMITGLAARYSPEELRFILIDGKQGVEFEVYRDLPHADIVCLRTSPAMARSVLADYVMEMEARFEAFQAVGAAKLEEYREKSGRPMPRKILIVDEYQQLLEGDPETGGQLLVKILTQGRAAGTHVVLGSQTFGVQGLPPSALTHVHTRASLALAPDYVQALQVFGPEGKRLIRELAPSGQVVVNDESGRDGANARGAVARFRRTREEDTLKAVIEEITVAGGRGRAVVLSGREACVLSDNSHVAAWTGAAPDAAALQGLARRPVRDGGFGLEGWSAADRPVGLWLGRRIAVHGHALCALRRAPAQNLLVLGSQVEIRNRMLASALAALPTMLDARQLDLVLMDGLRADMPGGGILRLAVERLQTAGATVTITGDPEAEGILRTLAAKAAVGGDSRTALLVVAEPDYLYSLHGGADRFAAPASGAPAGLRTILNRGPQHGVHTIVTASGLSAFGTILAPNREGRLFNHRVVQKMTEDDSMTLFSSLVGARLEELTDHPNAFLLADLIQGTRGSILFHGYGASRDLNGDQGAAALNAELGRLAYREPANVA